MVYHCNNERRRELLRAAAESGQPIVNAIDYLEVDPKDQARLQVHCILPVSNLSVENVVISGGVRVRNVKVVALSRRREVLDVTLNHGGDFSLYTLRLVARGDESSPPNGFDPQLREVTFSFKVACPSVFDCKPLAETSSPAALDPNINYLAKDYASFRQLMLDRLQLLVPGWREQSPADVQMVLVELLAYVADHLSYYQDAVATEAYLMTARRRVSVRRHARLLDYRMHEGTNARVWVVFDVSAGQVVLPRGTPLLTAGPKGETRVASLLEVLGEEEPEVFQCMSEMALRAAHNTVHFHTWQNEECCVPEGATSATLRDGEPHGERQLSLKPGDVLLFEEVRSPITGAEADRDPTRRHAVRLRTVEGQNRVDPLDGTPVLEVTWDPEDALPFCLCVSKRGEQQPLSVARGNVALADHGRRVDATLVIGDVAARGACQIRLPAGLLTFAGPDDDAHRRSARSALSWRAADAKPSVTLWEQTRDPRGGFEEIEWTARSDLLSSDEHDRAFVVEVESGGVTYVRFGDGIHGRRPLAGAEFRAELRVGNGTRGNVGAEVITRIVSADDGVRSLRNPLPARGGVDAESLEQVRQFAPRAFRTQERAVTPGDYALLAQRNPDVQQAAATIRWTGSWHTAFVTADRRGGQPVDPEFRVALSDQLERFRMAGQDVQVDAPIMVPLDLSLRVCLQDGFFQSTVRASLLKAFGTGTPSNGVRGFFHPDNFTFGQPVYLSQLYSTASRVSGVQSAHVTRFQRWGKPANRELSNGVLETSRFEIVRLDNDPNFPEYGRLELELVGGL